MPEKMNGVIFTFVLLFTRATASLVEFTFTQNDTMSGRVPTDVSPITSRGTADCGCICTSNSQCRGFYHSTTGQDCYLDTYENLVNFNVDNNAVYFGRDGTSPETTTEVPTTLTTGTTSTTTQGSVSLNATTVSSLDCPTTLPVNTLFEGDMGNNYVFKLFDVSLNYADARQKCADEGMRLFRPTTGDKITEFGLLFNFCSVYDMSGFWVESQKSPSGDWLNSDNSTVPNEAWCSSTPGNQVGQNCARLAFSCYHKLKDTSCASQFSVICVYLYKKHYEDWLRWGAKHPSSDLPCGKLNLKNLILGYLTLQNHYLEK